MKDSQELVLVVVGDILMTEESFTDRYSIVKWWVFKDVYCSDCGGIVIKLNDWKQNHILKNNSKKQEGNRSKEMAMLSVKAQGNLLLKDSF